LEVQRAAAVMTRVDGARHFLTTTKDPRSRCKVHIGLRAAAAATN